MSVANNNKENKEEKPSGKDLRIREFKPRNSLLTDLFEVNEFKSIRHCFIAIIITTFLNGLLSDQSALYGFRYIFVGFGQFPKVIFAWILMFPALLFVYPSFCFWAKIRITLKPKSFVVKLWDKLWLVLFVTYFTLFFCAVPYFKLADLPIASAAIVLGEQIRMLMKMHAFVRSNVPRVLHYKVHSDETYPIPDFSKFFYYLFAPTFIYKDEYPRTKSINWSFVLMNFAEIFGVMYFFSFLTANYMVPDFENFGLQPYDSYKIIKLIFRMILPSSLILLLMFYLLLHAWHNAWAEMLRFADRLFYLDWWNAATYSAYYRRWNIVVHDYLYTYIYRDIYETVVPGNTLAATCTTFLISALVHEYILIYLLKLFFPVLFVQFLGCGMLLTFVKFKHKQVIGNTFLWWSLSCGIGIQVSLYVMEYYARINCPQEDESFFKPKIFTCNVQT